MEAALSMLKIDHLPEIICEKLRANILNGVIKPGTVLNERSLAVEMEASRTPVREALIILETEGLVRRYPKLGVVVTELSIRDITEAFQIREFVEPPAAAFAASNPETYREELLFLRNEFNALFGSDLDDEAKYQRHNTLDSRLHDLILSSLDNKRLEEFMTTICATCSRVRNMGTPMRFDESTAEHTALIHALLDGAPEGAAECMRVHLENTRKRLLLPA